MKGLRIEYFENEAEAYKENGKPNGVIQLEGAQFGKLVCNAFLIFEYSMNQLHLQPCKMQIRCDLIVWMARSRWIGPAWRFWILSIIESGILQQIQTSKTSSGLPELWRKLMR